MVINMDKSDENFINDDGEVNVVSGIQHNVLARFDRMVATLYTTLEYVKTYADVKRRLYLVQNFETNFGDYGFQNKKIANSTYNALDGIEYITISKWCERWLKEDFGKSVRYAPNGIDSNKFSFKKREFGKRIRVLVEGNSEDYYKNVDEAFKVVEKLDKKKYEIVYLSYLGKPKEWYHVDCFYNKVPYGKVPEVYKSCDILLKTSILESFSYPPLEMMATGGYVVVVPNEGNSEYLADGVNCLLYEQGNIDEAVEKIERIYSGKKLRKALDVGAKDTVNNRDWGDIEDKILDLYR
jgi:glycosyltransferase involved in cell wall biosynthesis